MPAGGPGPVPDPAARCAVPVSAAGACPAAPPQCRAWRRARAQRNTHVTWQAPPLLKRVRQTVGKWQGLGGPESHAMWETRTAVLHPNWQGCPWAKNQQTLGPVAHGNRTAPGLAGRQQHPGALSTAVRLSRTAVVGELTAMGNQPPAVGGSAPTMGRSPLITAGGWPVIAGLRGGPDRPASDKKKKQITDSPYNPQPRGPAHRHCRGDPQGPGHQLRRRQVDTPLDKQTAAGGDLRGLPACQMRFHLN